MNSTLLILHALLGTALLGSITHQVVSLVVRRGAAYESFFNRYAGVNKRAFTRAVVVLYVAQVALGAIIYPAYRLTARIEFEEMSLGWAVGLFELKEHFAGIGLMMLPFYSHCWRTELTQTHPRDRMMISILITFIVWWDFLVGHVLNNIRGLT